MRKFFWAFCIVFCLTLGLRIYSALFFSIKNHQCLKDNFISDDYCSRISDYIVRNADDNYSLHNFMLQIKKEFPGIKVIKARLYPQNSVVKLKLHQPLCVVNETSILMANNEFVPKDCFTANVIQSLPTVSFAMETVSSSAQLLRDIFDALPPNFNNFYNLDCINEHSIRLGDKKNSQFMIVSTCEQKNYQQLFEQCEFIKKSLSDRGLFNKGIEWIADARFAHYIIVYKA